MAWELKVYWVQSGLAQFYVKAIYTHGRNTVKRICRKDTKVENNLQIILALATSGIQELFGHCMEWGVGGTENSGGGEKFQLSLCPETSKESLCGVAGVELIPERGRPLNTKYSFWILFGRGVRICEQCLIWREKQNFISVPIAITLIRICAELS